ncbi:hypothetical protein EIN_486000 [Entamoeba invadens IP1]|uniref:Uncharacterized protein n=1 Tax=Entamoeba invadens IP1 TaxID=370355 RepID=A0A0A1UAI7_ENTIV|nr:hypothetical protein EIN_486000 [Entamoeba invadens IP1]ELP89198.1 hypothetical protein EIN_486000 [Entamoeba invadens IP1]|eukprot:XP_004255969.1 hypothetical protein EIN_486000 [Entamoeba invadens IP1]
MDTTLPSIKQYFITPLTPKEEGVMNKVNELLHGSSTDIARAYTFLHDGIARPAFVQLLLKVNPLLYTFTLQSKPIGDCTSIINSLLSFLYQMIQTAGDDYIKLLLLPATKISISFGFLLSDHTLVNTQLLGLQVLSLIPINHDFIELIPPLSFLAIGQHAELALRILKKVVTTKEAVTYFVETKCVGHLCIALHTQSTHDKEASLEIIVSLFRDCDDSLREKIATEINEESILEHGFFVFTQGTLKMKVFMLNIIAHMSYVSPCQMAIFESGIMPLVVKMLGESENRVVMSALVVIQYITESQVNCDEFEGIGVVPLLTNILKKFPDSVEQKVVINAMEALKNLSTNDTLMEEMVVFDTQKVIEDLGKKEGLVKRVKDNIDLVTVKIKSFSTLQFKGEEVSSQERATAHEFLGKVYNVYKYRTLYGDYDKEKTEERLSAIRELQKVFVDQYNETFDINKLSFDNVNELNVDIYLNVSESLDHCEETMDLPSMSTILLSKISQEDLTRFYSHRLDCAIKKNTENFVFKAEQKHLNLIDQFVDGLVEPMKEICSVSDTQTYFNVIEKVQTIVGGIQESIPADSSFEVFLDKYMEGMASNSLYKTYAIFINAQDRNTFEYPQKIAEIIKAYEKENKSVVDVMGEVYHHINKLHMYFDVLTVTHSWSKLSKAVEEGKDILKKGEQALQNILQKIELNYLGICLKKLGVGIEENVVKSQQVLLRYKGMQLVTMVLVETKLVFLVMLDKKFRMLEAFPVKDLELIGVMQSDKSNKAIFGCVGESFDIVFFNSNELFEWKHVFGDVIKGGLC